MVGRFSQLQPGAAYGIALFIQETTYLPDHDYVLALIIAAITPALHRFELGKFLLPVAQYVRLDLAQVTYLANREVSLARNRGEFIVVAGFQHMLLRAPLIFVPGEMSPPGVL